MVVSQVSDYDGVGVLRGNCMLIGCSCQCYKTEEANINRCIVCEHASALHANLDQKVGDYRDAFSYYAPEPSPLENKRYQYNNEPIKAYEGMLTEVRFKVMLYGKCNAKGCDCEGFVRDESESEGDRVMAFHRGSCCPHRAFVHKPIGSEEVTTQADIRDILRGKCTIAECNCECYTRLQFQPEGNRRASWHWCSNCFHSPVHHINLGSTAISNAIKVKLMSEKCEDSECDCTGFTTQEEGDDVTWKTCEYCEHTGVRHRKLVRQQKQTSQQKLAEVEIPFKKSRAKEVHMEEICPDDDYTVPTKQVYAQRLTHNTVYESHTKVTTVTSTYMSKSERPASRAEEQNEALVIEDISDENDVEYDKDAIAEEQSKSRQEYNIITEIIREENEDTSDEESTKKDSSSSEEYEHKVEIQEITPQDHKDSGVAGQVQYTDSAEGNHEDDGNFDNRKEDRNSEEKTVVQEQVREPYSSEDDSDSSTSKEKKRSPANKTSSSESSDEEKRRRESRSCSSDNVEL